MTICRLARNLLTVAALVVFSASSAWASLITVDFGGLSGGNGDAFTTPYVEDGFTVTPTGGDWFEAHVFGNPEPSIFAGPVGSPSTSTIDVTGGTFLFSSVDLSSNSASNAGFQIEGFYQGTSLFTVASDISNINTFNTIAFTNPSVLDLLRITMTPVAGIFVSYVPSFLRASM